MMNTPSARFNWRVVLTTALLGLVFAVLTITGALPGVASTQWVALALLGILGLAVGLTVSGRPLRHGIVAGFLAGLIAVEAQALFMTTYFANNPQFADIEIPFGFSARAFTALFGPLNAILAGAIAGMVAWIVWMVRRLGQ